MLKNLKIFSLPEIEEQVLRWWKEHGIVVRGLTRNKDASRINADTNKQSFPAKHFVFYEGPPTANGRPGIHHVLARAFKDIIPRFKTMQGYYVPRKAGWDTHGLPVEIEAEKELFGFSAKGGSASGGKSKQDIEKYGIAKFNQKCKELVWKYRADWEQLTSRMGFWLDMEHPYITYETSYMESVWWLLSQIHKRRLLKKLFKTVPWCPRCQTPLSSHELGQPGAYKTVKDNSVYLKFKLKTKNLKLKTSHPLSSVLSLESPVYILSWTTTPWTLPGNVALAVGEGITYALVYKGSQTYVLAKDLVSKVLGDAEIAREVKGKDLVGLEYEQLFDIKALRNKKSHRVYAADFVTTEEGTGVVHTAVMYGEDDYKLGVKVGLPQHHTVDETSRFKKEVKGFNGLYVKADETEKKLIEFLRQSGALLKTEFYEHEYPYCWRCGKPLIYYARESWFIEMSKIRGQLTANNKTINWIPSHIKEGRFGEWIKDAKDWSISRNRYWGTPLPLWECEKNHQLVIGSLEDLRQQVKPRNKFFILRHGEATHNVEQKIASGPEVGHNISELTIKGLAQAEKAAKELKKQKINLIVTSPYLRAQQTAKMAAKVTKAKIITDKRLGEVNTGIYNWQREQKYHSIFSSALERFAKAPQGGESLNQVRARMVSAIRDLEKKYKNKNILIISHGDPLWLLKGSLEGKSNEQILADKYYPEPGSWQEIVAPVLPFDSDGQVNLHRPFIDEITFACSKCRKPMKRIKDVIDVWFDSGAMPWAQHGLTRTGTRINTDQTPREYPAEYIAEAIDQTRGWFYTLLAISTLMKKGSAYKNVICLGHINDKNGAKMSKSKGNVVDPWQMMNKYGADAVRWHFFTINEPGDPKNFDEAELAKVTRRFILILYNCFVFYHAYGVRGSTRIATRITADKNILDRWVLASLNMTVEDVTKKLERYDVGGAARAIESFTDDLSRWYIRRSRERFQGAARGDLSAEGDWEAASITLETVLLTITKLIAPFMPFFAESLYLSFGNERSVHLEDWPRVEHTLINKELLKDMGFARDMAAKALALRAEARIKIRQPLARLTLHALRSTLEGKTELLKLLADEVNVKEISFNKDLATEISLDTTVTPELKEEGVIRELTRTIQGLRQDAQYKMSDEITLMISGPDNFMDLIQRHSIQLKKSVNAKQLELKKSEKFDVQLETKIDNWDIWLGVLKI